MIVVYIIFGLILLNTLCSILYARFGIFKLFYHDLLQWHQPDEHIEEKFDGASFYCICKHCGKEIIQDSQGNWYEA